MTRRSPIWQAILWIERYLPTPAPLPSEPERRVAARRHAALVPLLVLPAILAPIFVRQRHQIGELMVLNHVLSKQLMIVLAGSAAIAAIGFGMKAWRDAEGRS